MIHYHVWFDLKPHVNEAEGLAVVERFLARLTDDAEAARFQLLRNRGAAPRSKLSRYHALIEFESDEHLAAAMRQQAARGIHAGLHGAVIDVVTNFHVEIFSAIAATSADRVLGLQACEI